MQAGPVGFCAVKRTDFLKAEDYATLRKYRPCDLGDAMNGSHVMSGIGPAYRPVAKLVGPAITVSLPGSGFRIINTAMRQALPGDVIVISTHDSRGVAYWGGEISKMAKDVGIAGVVVDGAVRDPDEMEGLECPAFSRSTASRAAIGEASWGEINMPVACGGIVVSPGDIIVADEFGIVAVPSAWVACALFDTEAMLSGLQPPVLADVEQRMIDNGILMLESAGG